jgi:hypothetical protein
MFNFSVTKVLYRSHNSLSSILNAHNDSIRRIYPRPNRSVPAAADVESSNGLTNAQLSLPEEIRFAKLMTWLSIAFVLCWLPQLVSKKIKNNSSEVRCFLQSFLIFVLGNSFFSDNANEKC